MDTRLEEKNLTFEEESRLSPKKKDEKGNDTIPAVDNVLMTNNINNNNNNEEDNNGGALSQQKCPTILHNLEVEKQQHHQEEDTSCSSLETQQQLNLLPKQVTPFLRSLRDIMFNDRFKPDITFWGEDGTTIHFKSKEALETLVLPHYFGHSNYRSFARQLNSYNFTKVQVPSSSTVVSLSEASSYCSSSDIPSSDSDIIDRQDRICDKESGGGIDEYRTTPVVFKHPLFLRDREDLLEHLKRKKYKRPQNKKLFDDSEQQYHYLNPSSLLLPLPSAGERQPLFYQQQDSHFGKKYSTPNIDIRNQVHDLRSPSHYYHDEKFSQPPLYSAQEYQASVLSMPSPPVPSLQQTPQHCPHSTKPSSLTSQYHQHQITSSSSSSSTLTNYESGDSSFSVSNNIRKDKDSNDTTSGVCSANVPSLVGIKKEEQPLTTEHVIEQHSTSAATVDVRQHKESSIHKPSLESQKPEAAQDDLRTAISQLQHQNFELTSIVNVKQLQVNECLQIIETLQNQVNMLQQQQSFSKNHMGYYTPAIPPHCDVRYDSGSSFQKQHQYHHPHHQQQHQYLYQHHHQFHALHDYEQDEQQNTAVQDDNSYPSQRFNIKDKTLKRKNDF